MTVRVQTTPEVSTLDARSSRRLRWIPRTLAAAALVCTVGCAGTSESVTEEPVTPEGAANTTDVTAEAPVQAALRNGVLATPETVGGFSMDGVGVFLSAANDTAEMTLYVVAPAEAVTFARPALYLTTQEGDHETTDVAEFETVTLQMGESRTFRQDANGPLTEVFADFAGGDEG